MARPVRNDPATLAGRLEANSIPVPFSGCILWTAGIDKAGYGKIGIRERAGKPKTMRTHRLAYILAHGALPNGTTVMHKCDVPLCINVEHLMLGTQTDNLQDMWRKGRARPGQVPSHERTNAKLSIDAVRYIRTSPLNGKQLAKELGVSDVLIYRVRNGQGWKDVT